MNFAERDECLIRKYGRILVVVMVLSFGVLLYYGRDIYQTAPPLPEAVVTTGGETIYTLTDIETGQDVWRSIGGHELGSVRGHGAYTALFGVCGMLGIGLTLFSLRVLTTNVTWNTTRLKVGFWATNIGLALMVLFSLLPVGLAQIWASVEHGMWYARSAEFLQTPIFETFRWLRAIGDTVFAIGIVAIGWFVVGLSMGWSRRGERTEADATSTPVVGGA